MYVSSHVQHFVTPWTIALQAPLSMEFSRQEHWSGLPFLSPGNRPNLGIEPLSPVSPTMQAGSINGLNQYIPLNIFRKLSFDCNEI